MACWLLKTEPSEYSFTNLVHDKRAVWSGISNAAALKNLRAMAKGDELLIYHTGGEKAVVGRASVARAAYPDPDEKDGKLVVIDIVARGALAKPVTLATLKGDKRFAEWALIRIGRLSVVPTTQEQFEAVLKLANG